ncbi:hypothetical protein N658DRAFT_511624 [Parathielavia hyrcaniae]|uniref:Uncharacterized protein n=1 Tax=Parathielavia hyrcaniae TaxID=113614 RepID=A0AAN6SX11_9PEZI|nr:hypothetical protein N658DRAFT_511624 [Parathielavia hyrcaniae]
MASQKTPNLSGMPASPAFSEDEGHAELVWLEVSTIDQILDHIVNSRKSGTESLIGFHWRASHVNNLFEQLDARLLELDQPKIRRVEYDYTSKTVFLDIMGESPLHFKVQIGLRDYIKDHICKLLVTASDPMIRTLLRSIDEPGTANIESDGKLLKQADSEPRQYVERKARQYIDSSDGKIRVVLILDLQYPDMKKAWVSLLAADGWLPRHELYHDDNLDQQPVGQIDLYLSDFVGSAGLPPAYCRPSTVELAAENTRNPMITLTYERLRAIFRRARHLYKPTEYTTEVGDEEENPYEEAERRVVEERAESERRLAEERAESERRLAEERIEADRRAAEARDKERAETERRVAEARDKERAEAERRIAAEVQRRVTVELARRLAESRWEAE